MCFVFLTKIIYFKFLSFHFKAGIGKPKSTKLEGNFDSTACDNHCVGSHRYISGKYYLLFIIIYGIFFYRKKMFALVCRKNRMNECWWYFWCFLLSRKRIRKDALDYRSKMFNSCDEQWTVKRKEIFLLSIFFSFLI